MSKNVLILAAHPDDETLGCGATIAKLSKEGYTVRLLTFTDGIGARDVIGNRNTILNKCCSILGIDSYASASFKDNEMDSHSLLEVCKFIERNILVGPDIIFTHHPECLNIDHSIVSRATSTVFRPQYGTAIKYYAYYVPSSTDYNPMCNFEGNVYFNVTDYQHIKVRCLKECYNEEMRDYPHTRSYSNIINLMKVWGSEVGLQYAEKFQLIREIFV